MDQQEITVPSSKYDEVCMILCNYVHLCRSCPLCGSEVPRPELEQHVNMCCLKDDEEQQKRQNEGKALCVRNHLLDND